MTVSSVAGAWRWPGGLLRSLCSAAVLCGACAAFGQGPAGAQGSGAAPSVGPQERTVDEWLVRMQQAARVPSYTGTFVVSAGGAMSSSRIWHVRQANGTLERVEALSGEPRSTFRDKNKVVTYLPGLHTVRTERLEDGGVFPNLFAADTLESTANFYTAHQTGEERVAGFDADIVRLSPRDDLRFGYRIWSEKRTGLVIKTQTLDQAGQVLEQAAFSELRFDAPVNAAQIKRMMSSTTGYKVEKTKRVQTAAESEGWSMKVAVPGFKPQSCYRSPASEAVPVPIVQCIFSDGLATVSLFIEPFDSRRHVREGEAAMGATHTLTQRLTAAGGDWWITAVGEVPAPTLRTFASNLERRR
ncbi:MAG: MucB/RseB C-terminal domain-containing protein [Burkholderiaceae bacterium]|jgi:sigma-E factor negative regulatory protein RseB|nr:MucB/RseB C-terminal domain-containing protein [Burkholderiaceae bacterium]